MTKVNKTIKQYVNEFVDNIEPNKEFQPRHIIFYIYNDCAKIAYDSTITRILRQRRADKSDILCISRAKSSYIRTRT